MAQKKRISTINPAVASTVKSVLRKIFDRMFNVRLDMPEEIRNLDAPYVLLPNHQGFWDPFLAGSYLKDPVYYITSDAVFRSRLFGFLLKFLGAIPKTKSQSDLDALKNIFDIKDRGCSIGIFPEGQRTWNGCTLPLIKSTSKLVRMLKLPVVTVVFKGGFFSHPRWGTSTRKGELLIEYRLLFKGDEVGRMKISDIHNRLTEALAFDEVEYQKSVRIEWPQDQRAENIEQFLFVCPSCGGFDGFSSKNSEFSCICGAGWKIDRFQDISPLTGNEGFDNLRDWDTWQIQKMKERFDAVFGTDEAVFADENLRFHTGFKSETPKLLAGGGLKLSAQTISLFDIRGRLVRKFPIRELTGMNVQNREVLDFYHDGMLYTVRDTGKHFNAYRIWRAVDYLQREKYSMNLPD